MKIFRKTFRKSFIKKKLLRKASAKAQSAMEYLMTYGWAILIVAVVLGAFYSLGVFDGAAFLGTSCIAASGFYCTNPTLSTGGVFMVTIGQATGTTLKNAYLYFVPSGTSFSTSDPSTSIGTLNSGQQVTVSIPLGVGSPYPAAYTLGTPLSGYLYLQFTDIYGITEVNKIATVLTKVTATGFGGATPSGIVAYVPITLTNSQSSATPSPFQQMIQINEVNYANYIAYNGNIANFEFYTQSGQILPAWIESNNSGTLTVWVNLPNGIPASASLTIYLGFASKTTNLLSSSGTSGIGEAPQLSCPNPVNTIGCSTYAEYDDGTSVFNFYDNFAGTSLNTNKWSVASGLTYSVNNGLSVTGSSQCGAGIESTATFSAPIIVEGYASFGSDTSTATGCYVSGLGIWYTSGGQITHGWAPDSVQKYALNGWTSSSQFWSSADNPQPSTNTYYVWGLGYISASSAIGYVNYQQVSSTSTSISTSGSLTVIINLQYNNVFPMSYYWYRVRAYPPDGVMPSVSFGTLTPA